MANQEHLDILKQGVEVWNEWRQKHIDIQPDLSGVDLTGAHLGRVHLSGANLIIADLSGAMLNNADLSGAHLAFASLKDANFRRANLSRAELGKSRSSRAHFIQANLSGVSLIEAGLSRADFKEANLSGADLSGAMPIGANFSDADLSGANLSGISIRGTIFGNVDLRSVQGLATVEHEGPSTIGIDTIIRSNGDIPEVFLRGAGVPDTFITFARSLISNPIQYYTCFISYSSKDQDFADRLYDDLQSKGVRCWFAPHDLKTGDRYRDRIDESIRLYDKLLLILSKHAVTSSWVEQEVEAALEKERHLREQGNQRTMLFPIKLDDTVMPTTTAWAANVRRIWHIGDFCRWKDHDQYQKAFSRLLRDLKAEG